jgi:hypothetical protein
MNQVEQTLGRGVRNCSHKNLPFEKRNVQIFLHGTLLTGDYAKIESADLAMYRYSEIKALQIGKVSRIIKEGSVDCILNITQADMTVENIDTRIDINISTPPNKKIMHHVGNKPYTAICDYMESCSYSCIPRPGSKLKINEDVFISDKSLLVINSENIMRQVRLAFKERHFYKRDELIQFIVRLKMYPMLQIDTALTDMITDKTELINDMYGVAGRVINIRDYYLFQPLHYGDEHISMLQRSYIQPSPHKSAVQHTIEYEKYSTKENEKDVPNSDNLLRSIYYTFELCTNMHLHLTREIIDGYILVLEKQIEKLKRKLSTFNEEQIEITEDDAKEGITKAIKYNRIKQQYEKEIKDLHKKKMEITNENPSIRIKTKEDIASRLNPSVNEDVVDIISRDRIWYIYIGEILRIKTMVSDIGKDNLLTFIIFHICERLTFEEKVIILGTMQSLKQNEIVESNIIKYFDQFTIDNYVLLLNSQNNAVVVYNKHTQSEVTDLDDEELGELYKKFHVNKSKFGVIMGFTQKVKDETIFKIKQGSNKGYSCKKDSITKVLTFKQILEQNKTHGITEEMISEIPKKIQDIYCICCELLLRWYDKNALQDKRWFLNMVEGHLSI